MKRYRIQPRFQFGADGERLVRCVTYLLQLTKSERVIRVTVAPWLWEQMKNWRNFELDVRTAVIRTAVAGSPVEVLAEHRGAPIRAYADDVTVECCDSSGERDDVDVVPWDWSEELEEIAQPEPSP